MVLREAMIIALKKSSDGKDAEHTIRGAQLALSNSFGGVTATEGKGFWVDKGELVRDDVVCLVSACEDNAENRDTLEAIADQIGFESKQVAVYLRYPSGDVKIRQTIHLWARPE